MGQILRSGFEVEILAFNFTLVLVKGNWVNIYRPINKLTMKKQWLSGVDLFDRNNTSKHNYATYVYMLVSSTVCTYNQDIQWFAVLNTSPMIRQA